MFVILESPYAGKKISLPWPLKWLSWAIYKVTTYFNIRYARKCLQDSLRRGESPFMSHLLYTQVLDDRKQAERELGIQAAFKLYEKVDYIVFYLDHGMSPGMWEAQAKAKLLKKQIRCREILS